MHRTVRNVGQRIHRRCGRHRVQVAAQSTVGRRHGPPAQRAPDPVHVLRLCVTVPHGQLGNGVCVGREHCHVARVQRALQEAYQQAVLHAATHRAAHNRH